MILGNPDRLDAADHSGNRATLDDLFRRAAVRNPDAIALADPPNRESFTEGVPRRLTYVEVDRMISAIASRLRGFGLQQDAVVATQLPNTVESVLMLLGIMRAGMIATPLPLLWREADCVEALGRVGAKALVTGTRVGAVRHHDLAMQVAARLFQIRFVCTFGRDVPDGVVPMDDLFHQSRRDRLPALERAGNPAAHVAVVTWDVSGAGLVPVARNSIELIAGGLSVFLEGSLQPDTRLLSTIPISSFAGISVTVMPWLLSGGSLSLHQGFDPDAFDRQQATNRCNTVAVPGPALMRLAEGGHLSANSLQTIVALWRAPECLAVAPAWCEPAAALDVTAFGEAGLVSVRRGAGGKPAPLPLGAIGAPHGSAHAVPVSEVSRTDAGTVAMGGPMVPVHAFPPGADDPHTPHLKLTADGFIDTGYACRLERDPRVRALTVTAPPAGLVGIGGYRFAMREVEGLVESLIARATITALPDALTGQRLAGIADDPDTVQAKLARRGVNPLIAGAFRPRGTARAA